MITALVSAVTGLVSGIAPKLITLFEARQGHKHEIEIRDYEIRFRQLDHKLAMERIKAEAGVKIDEAYYQAASEETRATREHLAELIKQQFTPTGIAWVDSFNAVIRPLSAAVFLVLFVVGLTAWTFGIARNDAFGAQLGAVFIEAVQAVLGFTFGYRSAIKPPVARG